MKVCLLQWYELLKCNNSQKLLLHQTLTLRYKNPHFIHDIHLEPASPKRHPNIFRYNIPRTFGKNYTVIQNLIKILPLTIKPEVKPGFCLRWTVVVGANQHSK